MAFPTIADTTTDVQATGSATHVVSLPATVNAGDLLLLISTKDGSGKSLFDTDAELSAWWPIVNASPDTSFAIGVWAKIADGTEDGTTVTIRATQGTPKWAAHVIRVNASTWVQDLAGIAWAVATSTSTSTPNPPSVTAHWGAADNLVIAGYGADDDDDVSIYPYADNNVYTESDASTTSCSMATCSDELTTATNDPGTFTIAAAEETVAFTIMVAPAGASMTNLDTPFLESVTVTRFASDTTAHLVNMPAVVNANDGLVTFFGNDGTATVTNPSGWTERFTTSDATVRGGLYLKTAVGNEDGTTVDFVTSAVEQATAIVYRFRQGTWTHAVADIEAANATSGGVGSTTPDPPNLTPSWGSAANVWIAAHVHDVDRPLTVYPTDYWNHFVIAKNTGAAASQVSGMFRTTAASQDPATFTIGTAEEWVATTVAIRPPSAAKVYPPFPPRQSTLLRM